MVEEYQEFRATMLTWPGMGGGGISLPYLEAEINDRVPARYLFYGFVNESEFVAACREVGVKAFGVVFCVQGWEFPVVLDDAESGVLQLNELHPQGSGLIGGEQQWLGLREFSEDRYPRLWPSFRSYFPDGLHDSAGEPIKDLWVECASKDIHGRPLHARWVECPDREHECHFMDLNNPAWREYLKAIVRIQVDAGVDGVQFDEVDSPLSALQYGGCFCRDCVEGFSSYLSEQPAERVPMELEGVDLTGFDFRAWMLAQGHERITPDTRSCVTDAYIGYLRGCLTRNFRELAEYVRHYAASKGRRVLVSANIYSAFPVFDGLVRYADVLVPEHAQTAWSQPVWTRYAAGLARDKPLCAGVNPYNISVVPQLVADLANGRSVSRFVSLIYEAAALGITLAVPYGSWMGSVTLDAFYAPKAATVEAQTFLADHEHLYSRETANQLGVLYSTESNYLRSTWAEWTRSPGQEDRPPPATPELAQPPLAAASEIAAGGHPFDVVILSDGAVAVDDLKAERLAGFRTLTAVGCEALTDKQLHLLKSYLDSGGTLLVDTTFGSASDPELSQSVRQHPATKQLNALSELVSSVEPQVRLGPEAAGRPHAVNIHRLPGGDRALHIVNYGYDTARDAPVPLSVQPALLLDTSPTQAMVHRPGREPLTLPVSNVEGRLSLPSFTVDLYAIAHLHHGDLADGSSPTERIPA